MNIHSRINFNSRFGNRSANYKEVINLLRNNPELKTYCDQEWDTRSKEGTITSCENGKHYQGYCQRAKRRVFDYQGR